MHDRSPRDEKGAISFGPFRLLPTERLLEKEGIPVHVVGRALDILIFLVERAGEVVSKKRILSRESGRMLLSMRVAGCGRRCMSASLRGAPAFKIRTESDGNASQASAAMVAPGAVEQRRCNVNSQLRPSDSEFE